MTALADRSRWIIGFVFSVLILAALACNVPTGETGETSSPVEDVYATITAQAAGDSSGLTQPAEESTEAVTETPTPTQTPTATPTPPESRTGNGENISIPRCKVTITVDGNDEDWAAQSGIPVIYLNNNTYGESEWLGAEDLSGQARMCWVDSRLYLYAAITDDVHVQTEQGDTAWKGDELELLFDADLRGDFYEDVWNDDDTQLGLSPGNFDDNPVGVTRYWPRGAAKQGEVEIAARQVVGAGGSYIIETAIPWLVLGVTPAADSNYGFCLAISDNDHVGTAQQDSMVGHCTRLKVPDPTTWVTLNLAP